MLNNVVFDVLVAGVICGSPSGLLVSNDPRARAPCPRTHSLTPFFFISSAVASFARANKKRPPRLSVALPNAAAESCKREYPL